MEFNWLRCRVLPGMFSNEVLVLIEDSSGSELASIFVDSNLVRMQGAPIVGQPIQGELKVRAMKLGKRANVMLPVSSAEVGSVLSVSSDLILS